MDPLSIIAGGLTGVGTLLSSFFGNEISKSTSKSLMRYQYNLNQQGIDTANRYNLPINQLDRLRSAGLNPNLVYGNGQVAGMTSEGNASTNQGYKQVPFDTGINDAVNRFLQSQQITQSVDESKTRQAEMMQKIAESMERQHYYELQNNFFDDTYFDRMKQLKQVIENLVLEGDYKVQLTSNLKGEANRIQADIDYIMSKTDLTREQIISEGTKRALQDTQMKKLMSDIDVNDVQMAYIIAKTLNVDADTENKKLWHDINDANWKSQGAFDRLLADHENWAIFFGILNKVFGSGGFISKF